MYFENYEVIIGRTILSYKLSMDEIITHNNYNNNAVTILFLIL